MQSKRNSLLSNLTQNGLMTLVTMLSPLLILSFISQNLGVIQYGLYATVLSYSFIYIILLDFGLVMELTQRTAKAEGCVDSISDMISVSIAIRLVSITLISPLFVMIFLFYVSDDGLLLLSALLFFITSSFNFSWFFQGSEMVKPYSKDVFVSRIFLILLVSAAVHYELSIEYYLFAQVISGFLLISLNLIKIKKKQFKILFIPHWWKVKAILKDSLGFYFSRLTVTLYESGSTFLVSRFLTVVETAQYAMMLQIFKAGSGVIGAVAMSLYPYINRTKNYVLLNKLTTFSTLTLVALFPFVDYIYPLMVNFIFGDGFESTLPIIKILYIGSIFQVSASFLGYPFFTSINKTHIAHKTMVLGSLMYFLTFLFFYLTDKITIVSMVICILVSLIFTAIPRLIFYLKYKPNTKI